MSAARLMIAAFVVCVLSSAALAQTTFVAGFLPNTDPSLTLASFEDIVSADFIFQYNTYGINFTQQFPDGSLCCVVSVADGFLTFGSATNFTYLEPFLNGTDTCTSFSMPNFTTFGVPSFLPGPYAGAWIPELNRRSTPLMGVTQVAPPASFTMCSGTPSATAAFTAIFKQSAIPPPPPLTTAAPSNNTTPQYIVQPYGPNYPAPAGYNQMYLSDVLADSFTSFYNQQGGILLSGINTTNYCCMVHVADGGWIVYGSSTAYSPLSLFRGLSWNCGITANDQITQFGTSFGGPYANGPVFPTLNQTTLSMLSVMYNDTSANFDDCNAFPDTLTLFVLA